MLKSRRIMPKFDRRVRVTPLLTWAARMAATSMSSGWTGIQRTSSLLATRLLLEIQHLFLMKKAGAINQAPTVLMNEAGAINQAPTVLLMKGGAINRGPTARKIRPLQ